MIKINENEFLKKYKKKIIALIILVILIVLCIVLQPPSPTPTTIDPIQPLVNKVTPNKDGNNWLKWLLVVGLALVSTMIFAFVFRRRLQSSGDDISKPLNKRVLRLLETSGSGLNCGLHSFIQGVNWHEHNHFLPTLESEKHGRKQRTKLLKILSGLLAETKRNELLLILNQLLDGGPKNNAVADDLASVKYILDEDIKEVRAGKTLTTDMLKRVFTQDAVKDSYYVRFFYKEKGKIIQQSSNQSERDLQQQSELEALGKLKQINIFHSNNHFQLMLDDVVVGIAEFTHAFNVNKVKTYSLEEATKIKKEK